MASIDISSYESQISQLATGLSAKREFAEEAFETKNKADEITKTLGEAKTFLSGKPVTKYLIDRAKAPLNSALEKAGVKMDEFKDSVANTIKGKLSDAVENIKSKIRGPGAIEVGPPGETPSIQMEPIGAVESATSKVVGENAMSSTYMDVAPSIGNTYTDITSLNAARQALMNKMSPDALEQARSRNTFEPDGVEAPTADLPDVVASKVEDATSTITKISKGATPEGVAVEEGGEAAAGVLDAIPGADIIGVALGLGLTIGSIIKKPKDHMPVDLVNATFQAGIN